MQRLPGLVVALALAVTLTAPPATARAQAQAQASAPAPLSGRDLPSVADVAGFYPAYVDGSRSVYHFRATAVVERSCLGWRVPRHLPEAGRAAGYLRSDGSDPYGDGLAAPAAYVYDYGTGRAASAALGELRRSVRRCYGRHAHAGLSETWSRVPTPRLGVERFAFRHHRFQQGAIDIWAVEVWARTGARLVDVSVHRDAHRVAADPALGLARAAVRRAR